MILAGDANTAGGVFTGNDPSWNIYLGTSIDVTWDGKFHTFGAGNILLSDGSAHQLGTEALREQFAVIFGNGETNITFSLPKSL